MTCLETENTHIYNLSVQTMTKYTNIEKQNINETNHSDSNIRYNKQIIMVHLN